MGEQEQVMAKSPFKSEEDDVMDLVMSAPADDAEEAVEGEEPVPGGDDEAAEVESKEDPSQLLDEAMASLEKLRGLVGGF
jgi:hypothetical protein